MKKKTNNIVNEQSSNNVNKKTKNKVSNIFWNVLLVVNIIVWGSLLITFFMNGRDFYRANVLGYRPVFVLSQSMEPTLDTHAIAVCKMNQSDYEIGDIIVYKQEVKDNEILIIHRIIDIYDDGTYQTKGDNNPDKDPWTVSEDRVYGKVSLVWNSIAPVVDFLFE